MYDTLHEQKILGTQVSNYHFYVHFLINLYEKVSKSRVKTYLCHVGPGLAFPKKVTNVENMCQLVTTYHFL